MTNPSKVVNQAVSATSNQTTPATSGPNLYHRDTDLAKRYAVTRVTIWRWVREGTYPKPFKLSPGCTRWSSQSVKEWEEAREQE